MTDSSEERVLDACLEEVLGGQAPPDMTARILAAWQESTTSPLGPLSPSTTLPPTVEPLVSTHAVADSQVSIVKLRPGKPRREPSPQTIPWLALAASLGLILAGGFVVWNVWHTGDDPTRGVNAPLAEQGPPSRLTVEPSPALSELVASPPMRPDAPTNSELEAPHTPPDNAVVSVAPDPAPAVNRHELPTTSAEIPDERPERLADAQIIQAIDELVRAQWTRERIAPAPMADDAEWCRRTFAKLIGRSPTADELSRFANDRALDKRLTLVRTLLQGEIYIEEFAGHWSNIWSHVLLGSVSRSANREGLQQYLRRAFAEGKSFDKVAFELLTATGHGIPGEDDFNGAANFLLAHADRRGVHADATAFAARTFLASSVGCAQCHNHPTREDLNQQRFWELNALFRQMRVEPHSTLGLQLANVDFPGEGSTPEDAELYYSQPNGLLRAAFPAFPGGATIASSGKLQDVDRRAWLAKSVVRSEEFRQAMVNRYWRALFGRGFTTPVDDIGAHNRPSHPELLSKLANQFAAHDYDVRALIRWIALSEPFRLSSEVSATDMLDQRESLFATFSLDRPDPISVVDSLRLAKQVYTQRFGEGATTARIANLGPNSDLRPDMDRLLSAVPESGERSQALSTYRLIILKSQMSRSQKIEHMFWIVLHRSPTKAEVAVLDEMLASEDDQSNLAAWNVVWWALANSREAQ